VTANPSVLLPVNNKLIYFAHVYRQRDHRLTVGRAGAGAGVTLCGEPGPCIVRDIRMRKFLLAIIPLFLFGQAQGAQRATFKPSGFVVLRTEKIGKEGKSFKIENSSSPLDGIEITFPEDALPAEQSLAVGYSSGTFSIKAGRPSGAVLSIRSLTGTALPFARPVAIALPMVPGTPMPVPYNISPDGTMSALPFGWYDRYAGKYTFYTRFLTDLTWVYPDTPPPGTFFDTGFSPELDGFSSVNFGNLACEGQCEGIAAFSIWYFTARGDNSVRLGEKYNSITIKDDVTAQDVIASRAQLSVIHGDMWERSLSRQQDYSDLERFNMICNAIYNTGAPVLLFISGWDGSSHAVVATGYNTLKRSLSIYDSNYPGVTKEIRLAGDLGKFLTYEGGESFIALSTDLDFPLKEPFEHICADADELFHGTTTAYLADISPAKNSEVSARDVTLTGTIYSGLMLASRVEVRVVAPAPQPLVETFSTEVGMSGKISIPVSLFPGENYIFFEFFGADCYDREKTIEKQAGYKLIYRQPPDESGCDLKRIKFSGNSASFQISKPTPAPCWVELVYCSMGSSDKGASVSCSGPPGRPGFTMEAFEARCPETSALMITGVTKGLRGITPRGSGSAEENCFDIYTCSRIILCGD